jgi:acyl-CoA synthetase (AMP-forming)/AMP-acid ligase II
MILGRCLPRNARLFPDKPAIIAPGGKVLTYSQLHDRVNRLANTFSRCGIRKGTKLAILGRSSSEYLQAFFAGAVAGAWLVPINFHLKPDDIADRLRHSEASALILDAEFVPLLRGLGESARQSLGERIWLIGESAGEYPSLEQLVSAGAPQSPDVDIDPEDTLYIGYTSGTTGPPKGALISHRAVAVGFLYKAIAYGLNEDDVTLNPGPFWHSAPRDYAQLALYLGGTCVVTDGFDPGEYLQLVERYQVTYSFLVPTMHQILTSFARSDDYDCSSLRLILSGGSPLPTVVKERVLRRFGPILHEFYGATETRVVTTISARELESKTRSVGRPMRDVEIRAIADDGRVLAPGEVGEIFIRGPGLFSGYHNDPKGTRKTRPGEWFSLGDLGRIDEDGYLYLVDRKLDMIISGGENIYPNDIEEVVLACAGVKEAAVIGIPDPTWGELVTAIVVPEDGVRLSAEALVLACGERLPAYMKPRRVVFAEALPRNPVGKILRRVLREPYWARQEAKI